MACKGKKAAFGYLARAALKITKIQIFNFREEKCSSVWSYVENIRTFWKKRTFMSYFDPSLVTISISQIPVSAFPDFFLDSINSVLFHNIPASLR